MILEEKIKQAVIQWRQNGYPNISSVTRHLLEFWFKEEHILSDGSPFKFWHCQKQAMESLIYIYEVCKYKSVYELAQGFRVTMSIDPTLDIWPKYCFKMATGSGKTWVMALALLWQYFNKIFGTNNNIRYTSHFLLLAPNLIVLDRLKEAFANNNLFKNLPFIPSEWQREFDLQFVLQSQNIPRTASGILNLTNIQQLYQRKNHELINPLDKLLGEKPKKDEQIIYYTFLQQLGQYSDLMVLNDEGHHVHSDDLEWNKIIADLNESATNGLIMQLDFTATPKDLRGRFFPHIIYNYPLAQAIKDKIVKRPRIGEITNVPDLSKEKDFVKKNRLQIDTGVRILQEFQKKFIPTNQKPVLFIMTDNTKNADKVGHYLKTRDFAGKVLVIHTNKKGIITKKDLDKARQAAREIDNPKNPFQIIVSVMMLKEGWDVRNVCVIVPLRAFDSPILPEQTLGRGLRRMFPQNPDLQERLIVIDHPRFRQLWEAEIESGELIADLVPVDNVYEPDKLIIVDQTKLKYDLEIPIVEGGLICVMPDLSQLDINQLPRNLFLLSEIELPNIMYREKDLLEQKIVREMILAFDYTENFSLYLSYICRAIASKVRASSIVAKLVPKVKDYIENYLFDVKIDLDDKSVIKKLNYIPVREKILEIFSQAVNQLAQKQEKIKLAKTYYISWTQPFHTSEPVYPAEKTVFNQLPYARSGPFEKEFMEYIDLTKDVLAFTKLFPRHPLHIPYHDFDSYLHYYLPDFIIKTQKVMYLIETKGGDETAEVILKDRAAKNWCQTVSELTNQRWIYVKIHAYDLENYYPDRFESLVESILK